MLRYDTIHIGDLMKKSASCCSFLCALGCISFNTSMFVLLVKAGALP